MAKDINKVVKMDTWTNQSALDGDHCWSYYGAPCWHLARVDEGKPAPCPCYDEPWFVSEREDRSYSYSNPDGPEVVCKDHLWYIDPNSLTVVQPYAGMDGYTGRCSRCGETVRLTEDQVTEILDTHDPETVARREADALGWAMVDMDY